MDVGYAWDQRLTTSAEKPQNFREEAWSVLQKYVFTLNDGLRSVIFKLGVLDHHEY
jgi:hypothetical protein